MNDTNWLEKIAFPAISTVVAYGITSWISHFFWQKRNEKKNREEIDRRIEKAKRDDVKEIIKLSQRIIQESDAKKDLELKVKELERKLKEENYFHSLYKEKLENAQKENKKLENEKEQLREILTWHNNFLWNWNKLIGVIDGNISSFEWVKKKEIIKIKENIEKEEKRHKKEVDSLRKQLNYHQIIKFKSPNGEYQDPNGVFFCCIDDDYHLVTDETKREDAIFSVKYRWGALSYCDINKKINNQTIDEALPKNWEEEINSKRGENIFKERDRLIRIIEEEKAQEERRRIS